MAKRLSGTITSSPTSRSLRQTAQNARLALTVAGYKKSGGNAAKAEYLIRSSAKRAAVAINLARRLSKASMTSARSGKGSSSTSGS